jgi:hypothetical protein
MVMKRVCTLFAISQLIEAASKTFGLADSGSACGASDHEVL